MSGGESAVEAGNPVPTHYYFPDGLCSGWRVQLKGMKLPVDSKDFYISFRTGPNDGADIALYFNPLSDAQKVVMNSFEGGTWKTEEVVRANIKSLVTNGMKFTLDFNVTDGNFDIQLNGMHFAQFVHRIPPELVKYLELGPGASFTQCDIIKP